MRLYFRALLLTLPRFFLIIVASLTLSNFDVSPLPLWTLVVAAYLLNFALTWLFAAWVFHKSYPTATQIAAVTGIFIIFGTLLEAGLYFFLTPQATFESLMQNYQLTSLWIVLIDIAAVALAGWRARIKYQTKLPEGIAM